MANMVDFIGKTTFSFIFKFIFLTGLQNILLVGVFMCTYVTLPWLDCEIIQWRAGPI